MAKSKEKKKSYLKTLKKAGLSAADILTHGISKKVISQACAKKDGVLIDGECIPKKEIRTGRGKK